MEAITTLMLFIAVPYMVARILTMMMFFLPKIMKDGLTLVLTVIGMMSLIVKQLSP